MSFRISTNSTFTRFLTGLADARFKAAQAQEQLSSGLRINRPSDDPTGTSRALTLSRRLASVERYGDTISRGSSLVDAAAAGLQHGSELMAEARTLVLQAINGTTTNQDRKAIATEFEILRSQLLEIGNERVGDQYVFGGTQTDTRPWESVQQGGRSRVLYRGNDEIQNLRIGDGLEVGINLPGLDVFGGTGPTGTSFTGSTGLSAGATANQGTGYEIVDIRHDSTDPGNLGTVGLALVDGGSDDTFLGAENLVIDTTAGTIQLGSGPVRNLPDPGDASYSNFVVANEDGGELHLDFTAFTGVDYNDTITGNGSVSIDGSSYDAIDFTETDLRLVNDATGSVVHIDTTGIGRAGEELVTFDGATNVFDLMQGIEEDLRNANSLSSEEIVARLEARLSELDAHQDNLISSASALGSRSQRLSVSADRALDLGVQLEGLLSSAEDADITEVALELARADQSLQLAQTAGARLLQTTLLNFL